MFDDPYCHEMLAGALALAAAGLLVFPCIHGQKGPATRRGFYDATTNPATIKRFFGGNFRRNLAVRTGCASGAWVLDVDNLESLKALEDRHGPLPATRRSQSSRGVHIWFRTTGVPIPSSAGRVAPGLDIKAERGYIVVPSSIHPSGCAYRWLNDEPLVEAPRWLVELARKPPPPSQPPQPSASRRASSAAAGAYGAAALWAEVDALAAMAPRTGRNDQLNRASFSLHQLVAGGELDTADVERELLAAATVNGLVARTLTGTKIRECSQCGTLCETGKACPHCGFLPTPKPTIVIPCEGELVEIKGGKPAPAEVDKQQWFNMLAGYAQERNHKPGYAYYRFRDKFGHTPRGTPQPCEPNREVRAWCRSREIAWAKAQQKARGGS
jgi:Bifunctional DNA primase/polymerase, N-terminal